MRLALSFTALAALAACEGGDQPPGPERRSAAGEVLGGEVSDDMLPLDTVRSTSPPGRSGPSGEDGSARGDTARPGVATPPPIPQAEVSGGPEQRTPLPTGAATEDAPPPE